MRLVLLATMVVMGFSVYAQSKIVVIDLNRVMQECAEGKKLQAQLDGFLAALRAEAKPMDDRMRQISSDANKPELTEQQRQELAREFEDLKIKLKRLQDDKVAEGRQMEQRGLIKIEKELVPLMEKMTEEEGYHMILEINSQAIFYAADGLDITEKVITRYDSINR